MQDAWVARMRSMPATVVSTTLEGPLGEVAALSGEQQRSRVLPSPRERPDESNRTMKSRSRAEALRLGKASACSCLQQYRRCLLRCLEMGRKALAALEAAARRFANCELVGSLYAS